MLTANSPSLEFENIIRAATFDFATRDPGPVPTHIPLFQPTDVRFFAISVALPDGRVFNSGDFQVPFTSQSIGKVFTFLKFVDRYGMDRCSDVLEMIPSPYPFNSLDLGPNGKPHNPMSNAGSIALWSYLVAPPGALKPEEMSSMISELARESVTVDLNEARRARESGTRNREIAAFLEAKGIFPPNISRDEVLEAYYRQCFVMLTTEGLAQAALSLALDESRAYLIPALTDFGLYEYSATWKARIGLPTKSSVSGALMIVIPGKMGIAIYAPGLDPYGNSLRGGFVAERFSQAMQGFGR